MHAQSASVEAPDPANEEGSAAPHVCPLCDTAFRRLEHLSRHILSHTGSKPHSCHVCQKSFNRKDTLLRHLPIHEDTGKNPSKASNFRIGRACSQCAKVRLRCDGQSPCARCRSRGINCAYSGRSRKRIPTIEELQQRSDSREPGQEPFAEFGSPQRRHSQQSFSPSLTSSNVHMDENMGLVENSSLLHPHVDEQAPLIPSEPLVMGTEQVSTQHSHDVLTQSSALLDSVPNIVVGQSAVGGQSTAIPPWDFNWTGESDFSVMDWITIDHSFLDMDAPNMGPCDTSHTFAYPYPTNNTNSPQQDMEISQPYKPETGRHPATEPAQMNDSDVGSLRSLNQDHPIIASKPKRDLERQWPTNWDPTKSDNLVSFPDMSKFPVDILEAESFGHVENLSPQIYHEICQSLKRNSSNHFRPFHNANLPSIEAFDCFIQLYFEYFHPIFPLLHKPSFNPRNAPWQLVLATATIGFRYSKVLYAAKGSNAIQELLRRSLAETIEGDNSNARELWFTQALLLGSVGMTYSGNRRLLEIAESGRNACITQCRRKGVFRTIPNQGFDWNSVPNEQTCNEQWKLWVEEESRRRLGFCTFIIDFQTELYFDGIPCLSLAELELILPCSEDLWLASTSRWWRKLYIQQNSTNLDQDITVHQALAQLGTSKMFPMNTSEFGKLILTMAIYRTIRSIRNLSGNPFFSNTLYEQSFINDSTNDAISLLQSCYPDVSSTKSMLSSSVSCHKHCVTMLLCCPRQALLSYVHRCSTMQQEERLKEIINHWVKDQNGCVARRAVSHAGLLLGKLNEIKFQAPYIPIMIALSTVIIWTYSHMTETATSVSYFNGASKPRERDSVIRLDGGELDQQREAWIQGNESFRAHLKDVGNIRRPGASYRIIDVGIQLLKGLDGWGLSQGLEHWLTTLRNRDWSRQQAELRNF